MTRRVKLAVLTAAVAGLIAVPVTLAAYGGGSPAPTRGSPRAHHPARMHPRARPGHHSLSPTGAPVHTGTAPLNLTVLLGAPVRSIPRSYLGLSLEYWGMPLFEQHLMAFTRALSLLQVAGDGPLILRVGGDSADRSLWDPGGRRLPQWVFRLAPRWLHLTNLLLAQAPLRLILDLNLVTASPLRAAAWARAAEARLRPGSIAAFEIGNEPDIYDRPYWLATIAHLGQGTAVLPAAISGRSYLRAFFAYARALAQFAPGVPLMGPAVANPTRSLRWIALLAAHGRPWLGTVTAHRYPYSACLGPGSAKSPTVARVLSETASTGNARAIKPAAQIAHRAGLPLRMTELNSVTCGGRRGVSNTFATALWAPDALFELMRAGVDGVNVHVRADTINAAMVPAAGGLLARPLMYGLMLFARTLSANGQLLATTIQGSQTPQLKAWAVQTSAGLRRVLLINKGPRAAAVALRVPAMAIATVQRLRAPGPSATSGETLNGRWLARDGTWRGSSAQERLVPDARGYALTVAPGSAALVYLP